MGIMNQTGRPVNFINHFGIVIDESTSMRAHASALVKAMDGYRDVLAQVSREQDQETRLTAYAFSSYGQQRCLFYDMDVFRVPSLAGLYHPNGMTALVDCTMLAISDLKQTATLYGQHALMITGLSDGIENDSMHTPAELDRVITTLPENWTTAAFGPDAMAVRKLRACGFPGDNVAVWDTTSSSGIERVGSMMSEAAVSFMQGRSQGIHGYNKGTGAARGGLFKIREFSSAEVTGALTALSPGSYALIGVPQDTPIKIFVETTQGRSYRMGEAYYEFTKKETVQPKKEIAVLMDGRVYSGRAARGILGLPDHHVQVAPDHKQGCTIFVQSTSPNRKLLAGTRLLLVH
jgi:hypothetical protein